jgi:hypothetical protein
MSSGHTNLRVNTECKLREQCIASLQIIRKWQFLADRQTPQDRLLWVPVHKMTGWMELSSVSRQRNSLLREGNYLRVPAEGDKRERIGESAKKKGQRVYSTVCG